jgi:hypothetical protein
MSRSQAFSITPVDQQVVARMPVFVTTKLPPVHCTSVTTWMQPDDADEPEPEPLDVPEPDEPDDVPEDV